MTTYHVTAERDGDWWTLTVEGVEAGFTQARRLDQAEAMAREVISLLLDIPVDDIDVDLEVHLDPGGQAALTVATAARQTAERAAATAQQAARDAARLLSNAGLPMRDVGAIMGISHQRVHQLLHS